MARCTLEARTRRSPFRPRDSLRSSLLSHWNRRTTSRPALGASSARFRHHSCHLHHCPLALHAPRRLNCHRRRHLFRLHLRRNLRGHRRHRCHRRPHHHRHHNRRRRRRRRQGSRGHHRRHRRRRRRCRCHRRHHRRRSHGHRRAKWPPLYRHQVWSCGWPQRCSLLVCSALAAA
jgi:hypothetical protein